MRAKEKKEINIEVGENIRLYRERAGYSRERFSELMGVSPRFIADVEAGFAGVSLTTFRKLCEVLGVSADRLLWRQEPAALGMDEQISHLNPEYVRVVRELVLKQLEVIAVASKENRQEKTRR